MNRPAARATAAGEAFGRLSVIIPNYNYGDFVGAAVQSALALDWPDVEVVVVDDGSTDHSRDVLEAYTSRITLVLQENRGQREACNTGFARSTGDAVVFLDSDDLLEPGMAHAVAARWTTSTSKVQVQMQRVDAADVPFGAPFPRFPIEPSPGTITRWYRRTSAYPTPPGSGNVYSRWFLAMILPLDARTGAFADSGCLAAAPFLGDVVTVRAPLVRYRQHDSNDSALLAEPDRFAREIERAADRYAFGMSLAGATAPVAALRRSRELLQFRVADLRVRRGAPVLPRDTWRRLLLDTVRSPLHPGPEVLSARILVMAWSIAVLCAPARAVQRLLRVRYAR